MESEIFIRLLEVMGKEKPFAWATQIGISSGSFSHIWKTKSVPKPEFLTLISEKTGVSLNWLMLGIGPKYFFQMATDTLSIPDRAASDDYAYIPVAQSRLAAGSGLPAIEFEEGEKSQLAFLRPWLSRVSTSTNNLVVFEIEGDSMEPTLMDGDLVLIDRGRTDLRTGKIFAVCVGGDLLQLKRLDVMGGKVRVISDNRDYYPTTELDSEQVQILGQAIWLGRELVRSNFRL